MNPVREDPQQTRSPAERASSRRKATHTAPRSKDGIPSSRGRTIFVAGYYGFANAGDEAILQGMLDALRHLRSDLDIVVLSGNPEQTSVSHRVRSVLFTDVPALVEAAASAELLLLGGGGLFHDHFGFAADTVLCPDHGGLALFSGIPLLASLLEKPLMIFGAGVGPLKTVEAREFTKFAFDQCRIATVRNSASRAELLTMGIDGSRVRVLPDPAFIMEPVFEEEIRPLLERSFPAGERPLLGVALRNWNVSVDAEAWEREVAKALDVFLDIHAGRALLVPLQELAGDLVDDRAVARRVQARMQHRERTVVIEAVGSPMRKAALLGRCQVVLGMRLHSLIFALRAGVPPVAVAYDDKVLCLAEEAGLAEFVLPIQGLTSEAIVSRLERALRDRQEMAPRLAAEAARRAELARENARLALSVLEGDIPPGEDRGDAVPMLKRVTLGLSRQATAYHAEIRRQAAQHAEGVAYLRDRIAALEGQLETIHLSRAWRWLEKYRRARLRLRALGPRRAALACRGLARRWLPATMKRALRRIWKRGVEGPATPQDDAPVWGDGPSRYDVVCFSIIDWDFRWQRPQQLMSQFAEHGHRVFFISPSRFHRRGEKPYSIHSLRENVWEVQLTLPQDIHVYSNVVSHELAESMVKDLAALRSDWRIETGLSIVQVATWAPAARRARELFSWRIVYDCMDEWHNFPGIGAALLDEEERLVHDADVLVVSAEKLRQKWSDRNGHTILARNAADFLRFNQPPPDELLPDVDGPVVGYFGAIADWFDLELVTRLARERPRYTFVLLGGVFGVCVDELEALPNVRLLGQKPYELMPLYMRRFDACLIPFKVSPITAATDPVKFYEYLSQGKPVVASQMPELAPYARLLYIARDHEDFIAKVDQALNENDLELRRQRMDLARGNTWQERFGRIDRAVREVHPMASIVIVTYENLEYTRRCLDSVFRNTSYPRYEVIVVDNGSRDGTREYLEALPATYPGVRAILNNENLGFARANNQGLRMAIGQRLVLLNNDTVVPRGWLTGLLRHLERPEVGLVVSVTNFSGNESRIEVPYTDLAGMDAFAWRHCRQHEGEWFDIRVAAMYCLGMRRDVFERVGDLDERFGVGLFEDDDYSHRMRLSGYRVICAEDVFIHHYGQASFKKLSPREYQTIWNRNQRLYEEKWGTKWTPHTMR